MGYQSGLLQNMYLVSQSQEMCIFWGVGGGVVVKKPITCIDVLKKYIF
jgi:hypothetical protein